MYKSIAACFLFISTAGFSYEFKPFKVSAIGGYYQDELNLSYRDERIQDPNAIREFFDTFHTYQTGAQVELTIPFAIFFRSLFLYGYGYTNKAVSQMSVVVQNMQNMISALFINDFHYKAEANLIDTSGAVGYPVKFGPFILVAFFGYGYDRQNIERKSLNFAFFSNDTSSANFKPSNYLKNKFYAPIFGLELRLTPVAEGRLILIGEYEFHWGIFKTSSGYLINTQTIAFTQNIKQNVNVKKRAFSHRFFLETLIGLSMHTTLGLKLKYSYLKAKKGQSNQMIFDTQNGLETSQNIQRTFNGLKTQNLGGEIEFSVQF